MSSLRYQSNWCLAACLSRINSNDAAHQGFDLLDPGQDSEKQEDLLKVSMMEDESGNIHLRQVTNHLIAPTADGVTTSSRINDHPPSAPPTAQSMAIS